MVALWHLPQNAFVVPKRPSVLETSLYYPETIRKLSGFAPTGMRQWGGTFCCLGPSQNILCRRHHAILTFLLREAPPKPLTRTPFCSRYNETSMFVISGAPSLASIFGCIHIYIYIYIYI